MKNCGISLGVITATAYFSNEFYDKPPIICGIMARVYSIARKHIVDYLVGLAGCTKRDLMENMVDLILPYTYSKIAAQSKFCRKNGLDFCMMGSFTICFFIKKITKIYEQFAVKKEDHQEGARERPSLYEDGVYNSTC